MGTRKVLDERVCGIQLEIPRHPRVEPVTVSCVLRKRPSTLHCVSADATSLEALQLMANHDIGAVLVMDGSRVAGVFSERDHARNALQGTQLTAPVRELITSCDIVANPTDSLQDCLNLMIGNHLRYLPVLEAGTPVAILSLEDSLKEMVAYLERVFKENGLDQQIVFLRGTYSC